MRFVDLRYDDGLDRLKLLDREKTAAFNARFTGLVKPQEGEIAAAMKHERIVETYEYGLSTAEMATRFAPYTTHHNIPQEEGRS